MPTVRETRPQPDRQPSPDRAGGPAAPRTGRSHPLSAFPNWTARRGLRMHRDRDPGSTYDDVPVQAAPVARPDADAESPAADQLDAAALERLAAEVLADLAAADPATATPADGGPLPVR